MWLKKSARASAPPLCSPSHPPGRQGLRGKLLCRAALLFVRRVRRALLPPSPERRLRASPILKKSFARRAQSPQRRPADQGRTGTDQSVIELARPALQHCLASGKRYGAELRHLYNRLQLRLRQRCTMRRMLQMIGDVKGFMAPQRPHR